MQVFRSEQARHPPAKLHYLHYFVASKNQPALHVVHATLDASQVEHPFVPSRHLYFEADVVVAVVFVVV